MTPARCFLRSAVRSLLLACAVWATLPAAHADWTPRAEPGLSSTPLSGEPQAIALSESARLAAIALRDAKAVAFVNVDSGAQLGRVNLNRKPSALVFNAAGTRAYVLSEDSNKLAVIDVASRTVLATWSIGEEPVALALDPARAQLVVADQSDRRLRALDPASGAQIRSRALNFNPRYLAFSADAQRLLVGGKGLLAVLDSGTWDEVRRISVGDDIRALAWWDAGALALAVGKKQDALNLINAQTGVIAARIALDGDPDAVALSQSEDRAFVSTRDDLSLNRVELNPRTLTGRYPLPGRAGGVAFDALTRVLLVTQPKDDLLLRLDPAQAGLIGVLTLNKRLRDISVNETTHEAAAIADKSDELSRIKLAERSVQRVALSATPQHVGIDTGLNRAVVSLRKAREEIAFVDLAAANLRVYPERIDLPGEISALAVDSTRALTIALTNGSRRIHVVDNVSRTLVASLPANDKLDALAIHAGRGTAYLVGDRKLLLLDLATRSLTQSISLGFKVDAIAIDEALDVAVLLSGQTDRAYVLDLAAPAIRASFALPRNPGELAIQRETHVAVVTSPESDALSLIDLQGLQATAGFSTLEKPSRLAVSARFNQALVLSAERDEIAVVQLPNPVPVLTQVVPAQAAAGTPTMTLMVHGKRFVDGAQVRFGATALATRWQSHSLLFADVPAALLTSVRSVPITAVHPGPGGGTSNALQFQVLGLPPQLNAIAPPSLIADGQAQLITATGANFAPGAQIMFGTQALITQFVSATQLQATVPGTLLTEPRGVQVSVVSAVGQSNALTLPIEPAAPVIDAISPISGTIGSTVTLTGRSFDPLAAGNSVVFTGGASAQVLSATLTELRVRVPLLAETGSITLTTVRGSAQSPPFTVLREQDASLVLNPGIVTVLQNARSSVSVNLSSTGSGAFAGLARLSVSALPAGISARFEPVTLSAYQTGTLVLSAAADAAPGTHLVIVRAELNEAGGTRVKSAPLSLTVHASSGVTGVAGRFVDREGRGIASVIARADTGAAVQPQTATDAAGNFLLTGLPAGALTLRFDATPAHPLYPIWPYSVVLESGKTLVLADFVIEAPPADDKFTAINNATQDQTITDARFPGVEILLPAGVEIVGWDGVKKTRIAVERREPENLPVPPPPIATRSVYQLYFGTPMGGIPSTPIPVALPNDLDLDPGAQTELWYFDGSPMGGSGEWKQAGTGTVSADGKSIVSDIGSGIPRFCGTCGLMCYRQVQDASPNKPCCDADAPPQTAGMQVTLATGQEQNGATDLVVEGEVPIVIAREFNPFDSFAFVANYQQSLGINWSFSYDIALLPFQDGLGVVRLVLPGNRRVDFTRATGEAYRNSSYRGFDGAELTRVGGPTLPAVPPARLSSGASSGTGGINPAPTCVADGALYLLRFKDGTQWRFEPSLNATPVRIRGGCLYHLSQMRDPRGRTLSIARNDKGQALSIYTSSGQSVRIEYSNEVISTITDNLGRQVTYAHVVVPNTSGSKKGFGGVGAGGATSSVGISQEPPPLVPRRLVSASTPAGNYAYAYEDDPELMRLGGLGVAGGASGTPAGQSIALPDHSSDTCQEQRGGTRIVRFTRPGLSGPVQLIYGKSKRVLRELWPDGTTLDFSYAIAGGCTARPGAIALPGERHARCQGASCPTVDSLENVQGGFEVLGGSVRKTSVSDSRGHRSTQQFNGAGLATEVIDASGQKTIYQRDGANRLSAVTDPQGRTWRYAYDERGNRTQALDPAGRLTETTYDAKWSKPTSITRTLAEGTAVIWQMRYDALNGNLLEMTDPEGNVTRFGYDQNARLVSITDPLNHTTRLAYNTGGEVIRITDALGNQVNLERDALGRVVASIDALGFRSETAYNALDQVTQVKDALGGITRLDYDANNHLAAVVDPLQHTVESYAYDAVGRLTQRSDARQKSEAYVYDTAGNLIEATDRKERATRLIYDEHNRVTRIDYPDGTAQRRSYDVSGRLERIEEGGFVEQYTYDALDRLTRVATTVNGLSTELAYAYDSLDRLIKRTVNGEEVTEYGYDRVSRLTHIVFKRPGLTDQTTLYTWDAASRLTQKTLPNGIRQVLSYDDANRLTRLQYLRSDGSVIETIDYAYDANGNRISKALGIGSVPETPFTALYDEANRMTQITLRPNTADAKTYALAYDLNGNLTTKQNTADAQDSTTYTWDARDRLIAIQAPGITASFVYDALGRRIERSVNGESTRYVYDGIQAIGEIKGNQTTTLLPGLAVDEMIARYGNEGTRVFLTDALGSVIAQARQDQSSVNWYAYSPYGETASTADDEGNAIGYTARENDGTELYFYRARYYDPVLKRFVAEDPIGIAGGANLYAYVDGNPVGYVDPWGEVGAGGFVIGVAIDLAFQLVQNGGNLRCIDVGSLLLSGALGAVGSVGWSKLASTGLKRAMWRPNPAFPRGREYVERSRWWPGRWGGPHADWNQKLVWGSEHAVNDPARHQFLPRGWKADNALKNPLERLWNRTPDWVKGGAAGGAVGTGIDAATECGCQ
jgi:RHS repeat-associated protein